MFEGSLACKLPWSYPLEVKDVHDSSPPQPKGSHPLEVKDVHDSSPTTQPKEGPHPLEVQDVDDSAPLTQLKGSHPLEVKDFRGTGGPVLGAQMIADELFLGGAGDRWTMGKGSKNNVSESEKSGSNKT